MPHYLVPLERAPAHAVRLPLIGAASVELSPQEARQYEAIEDEVISLPRTEEAHLELDTAAPTVRAPEVWARGHRGKGVTVAVIDTGASRHRDYADRLLAFHDCVNGKSEPYDDHGHGSHVAGIVGGNGKRVGIAPEAGLVAVKAFNREGKARVSEVILGIQWAVENRERYGIRVVNLSAAGQAKLSHQHDPLARAAAAAARHGLLVVAAAGNDGPDRETIGTPGNSPAVLTVGASDDRGTVKREDDRVAALSSRGPTPVDGLAKPDLVAPGVNVTATANSSDGYVTKSGTSMAAPMVAGVAALLMGASPEADAERVKAALIASAEKLPRGGDAHAQGAGLVDAKAALDRL